MHLKHRPTFCTYIFESRLAIFLSHRSFNQQTTLAVKHSIIGIIFLSLSFFNLSAQHQLSQTKSEKLFQKGTELIAHSNYGGAREVFSEFLQNASSVDPRRSEAEYYIAFTALSLGHADGEKLIEDFISNNPTSPRASTAYYDLANFFYNEKNFAKAATYYKKVDFPGLNAEQQNLAHFRWGYSLFNPKKLDESLIQFNFVKNSKSEYAAASSYYAGFVEYSKGDYDAALADLSKAEGQSSYATVVPYLIANIYYKQKRYDQLITYANGVKGRTNLANANEFAMLTAEAYYFKGDYANAASGYERYLQDNTAKAESALLFRAGFANYSLNQTPKAIDYLGKSAALRDSVSYFASYYLGILYLKQGEKPLAINAFDFARRNPADRQLAEESWFQFAKVSYDAGNPEVAIQELEKFLSTFPQSLHKNEVKELLAQAYVNGNNYHKAIEYIESLPSRPPQIEQAYQKATYLQGSELFNKENYPEAIKSFEKSLQYPKDPGYLALAAFWAAEAYSIQQNYAQALHYYNLIIDIPSNVDPELLLKTRYGLGYAHYNLQAYDKALFNFKEFVNKTNRNSPNHTDALIRLADCYYVSKQYQPAIETYDRARNIGSPDNDYILLQSGVINGIQRKYDVARNQFTTLIKSYPKSQYRDEALFQRGQFEIEQGNYQQAIDGLTQLINESPNSRFLPYAYMRRAASYYNVKQPDKTISDYISVVTKFPSHPVAKEALLPLQEALTAVGRSGEFDQYFALVQKANPDSNDFEQIEFETAKNLYFDQQYQKALEKLNSFVTSYPQSPRLSEAKFYIAESYFRNKEYAQALPLYQELSKDVNFSMGNRVEARIAELEFRLGKYENAISHFHRLEHLATNKKEQYNAWSGLMESFYLLGQYDSSAAYARTIIERGAVNASAQNKASLYLGKTAFAKGDYETAKDEFLNTVNAAQDEYGAEAKYRIAEIFYLQKSYKQSYETLVRLNKDFEAYDEWVGKSYLLLADNFIAMDDLFQAKETLQSLVDEFPLEHIKEEARRKLKEIEKTEQEKKRKAASDTVDTTNE